MLLFPQYSPWKKYTVFGILKITTLPRHGELKEAFVKLMTWYDKPDYKPTEEISDTTGAIIVSVEEMTARRESADGKTEFFIWKPDND